MGLEVTLEQQLDLFVLFWLGENNKMCISP